MAKHHPGVTFRFGYHSVPSMLRLHLHCISDDMLSENVKNKKHWNSFTTEFFVDSTKVIAELRSKGEVKVISGLEAKELMARPLKCHKCDYKPKHLPDLKIHLKNTH